jgi:hypothetical protein
VVSVVKNADSILPSPGNAGREAQVYLTLESG